MPYLAELAISAGISWPAIDFMRRGYELNGEPLRLRDRGQRWFARVLAHEHRAQSHHDALVLGATPWLTGALSERVEHTTVIDVGAEMLAMCKRWVRSNVTNEITFVQGDWLALPPSVRGLGLVAGDNSFSFLRYPNDWDEMLNILSERMAEEAVLFARLLSIPATHRRLRPAEIVENALARSTPVNFTAVRVALLFAHWNPTDYIIHTEDALATFDAHRAEFDPLFCDLPCTAENDLLSIEKYRNTGVRYFAPPLAEAIARFERRFRVRAVYFGPYEMSQYFPLIVVSKLAV